MSQISRMLCRPSFLSANAAFCFLALRWRRLKIGKVALGRVVKRQAFLHVQRERPVRIDMLPFERCERTYICGR